MEENENEQVSILTAEVTSLTGELSTKTEQFSEYRIYYFSIIFFLSIFFLLIYQHISEVKPESLDNETEEFLPSTIIQPT